MPHHIETIPKMEKVIKKHFRLREMEWTKRFYSIDSVTFEVQRNVFITYK